MAGNEASRVQCQERKEQYKKLLDQGSEIAENAETANVLKTLLSIQQIALASNQINETGTVRDRMENTSEVVMDAQVIKMSHELLGTAMQAVHNKEFSDEAFVNGLKAFISTDNSRNWSKLNELAIPIRKAYGWTQSLLGTFDVDRNIPENTQKERHRRPATQATQQMKPETVSKLQPDEKRAQVLNVLLKQIQNIFRENDNQSIPYYQAVIDPSSFMNSVDNCFQMAFLFKDGHIFLDVDGDGLPLISPVSKEQESSADFQHIQQLICTLNPRLMNKMIERYELVEPLLKIDRLATAEQPPHSQSLASTSKKK